MCKLLIAITSAGFIGLASSAVAAEADFATVDANGDGKVTFEEGKAIHTDWNEGAFQTLDTDGDGALSKEEYDAAIMKSN